MECKWIMDGAQKRAQEDREREQRAIDRAVPP